MPNDAISNALAEMERNRVPEDQQYRQALQQFSLSRLILGFDPNSGIDSSYEREICQEALRRTGRSSTRGEGGVTIPSEVLFGRRDLTVGNAGGAGSLVGTQHLGAMFIDSLQPRPIVERLGATVLRDLSGDVSIPRQVADATASWLPTEQGEAPVSELGTDQVAMSPKEIGVTTSFSRKLLIQSDPSVEDLVVRDLRRAINKGVDAAAISADGAGGAPVGILNQTGVSAAPSYTGSPDRDTVIDLETEVATDDADNGTLGYLATPALRGAMKKAVVDAGSGRFVWEDGSEPGEGRLNGYQAIASSLSATDRLIFGNWADLVIGLWSSVDILVNPYSGDTTRTIRVTAYQDADIAVRHPESFAVAAPA